MPDHIRGRVYRSKRTGPVLAQLSVEPTRAGDPTVHLWTYDSEHGEHVGVLLNAEQVEQLGIDLQIRASYMRGVRPPAGPEPDPSPGPADVPLLPDHEHEVAPDGR